MITMRYRGNMGNHMFRYCFGRILSERLGYEYDAPPIEGFPNTFEKVNGEQIQRPVKRVGGFVVDMSRLIANMRRTPHLIRCDGIFEYYPMFAPYKDKIRNTWLYLPQPYSQDRLADLEFSVRKNNKLVPIDIDEITPDDILVNYRIGDFLKTRNRWRMIDFDYFEVILSRVQFSRLFLASDNIEHPLLKKFDKYNAIYQTNANKFSTMNLIRLFNKIAISQSTYSWWAAYLSDATEIYFPWTKDGPWSEKIRRRLGLDLRVDEKRYYYVDSHQKRIIGNYDQMKYLSQIVLPSEAPLYGMFQHIYRFINRKLNLLPGY
ncbi:MAG: hypothetical protein LWX02_08080 [Deltaproteobacteria bacterium]|jgi:hypothetical protein|nr:hypothetical protein [Deltaproteobacteria bacterium]MDL1986105.1 hypothetical protein [Deltaproteobacteria bacterium]